MLARYLRWLMVVENVIYTALAWLGVRAGVLGVFGVTCLMLGMPLAVRAVFVGVPILYARWRVWPRCGITPPRPLAMAKMVFREWLAVIRLFSLVQPFETRWMPADRLSGNSPFTPVLLVHGYRCNRGAWLWMRRALEQRGHMTATLNLEPMRGDIDAFAEALAARIDEVCATTGATRVSLVGHSMGGLVILAYLRKQGGARVAKVVSLGTPFRGSPLAPFGGGRSARQMHPGNPWLASLCSAWLPQDLDMTHIVSLHDAYVPAPNASLPAGKVLTVESIAHLEMAWSMQVFRLVCSVLESPTPVRKPQGPPM